MTKIARTYDIESIMGFVKSCATPGVLFNEEAFNEYKATIFEHILRNEATIDVKDNKVIGFNLING